MASKKKSETSSTGQSKATKDHEEIKSWIEDRGGKPAVVASTHKDRGEGVLRVDFPDYSGQGSLQAVDWDEFFEIFDDRDLTFLYQDQTKSGEQSRFFKFISSEPGQHA